MAAGRAEPAGGGEEEAQSRPEPRRPHGISSVQRSEKEGGLLLLPLLRVYQLPISEETLLLLLLLLHGVEEEEEECVRHRERERRHTARNEVNRASHARVTDVINVTVHV